MKVQRAYTQCRYGQMHYREAAPEGPSAPTLILLHQNPSSSYEYELLMEALATDRRVIAFDTPGYGMSDPPPAPLDMAGYAAAFSDAIDALAIAGPIDVYGFHTGSLLTIELALLRSDKVARVAMTGIPMYPEEKRAELLRNAVETPANDDEGTAILSMLPRLWDYVVGQRDRRVPLERAIRSFADKAWMLDRSSWAYRGVWSYDYTRITGLTLPALLLQPDEQLREASLEAAALIPGITICHMSDLNRDIFEFAQERIANELRLFFD
ncbi:alpha/beta fold hydrolase [Sphingorhabdus sp. YGSMI21]|uniref:alpha/beta fold hydrolase n=1 Tax=Sphingorhabdus sp. YGSMI21 TaxID=2077182 RepID=UPI000C1DCADD|nr:alpha/beta fold hydrolase [Sphingorhabdus sp. YGSMI21]ATW03381.1 alpha/beta hydrolase [Sphingorhabdus sp. YGSMI21]